MKRGETTYKKSPKWEFISIKFTDKNHGTNLYKKGPLTATAAAVAETAATTTITATKTTTTLKRPWDYYYAKLNLIISIKIQKNCIDNKSCETPRPFTENKKAHIQHQNKRNQKTKHCRACSHDERNTRNEVG